MIIRATVCGMLVVLLATVGTSLADLSDGLVAYYPFNTNANDRWNGYDAEVQGPTLCDDRDGNSYAAYCFNSYKDIIRIPNEVLHGKYNCTFSGLINIDFRDGTLGDHFWTILSGAGSNANHNEVLFSPVDATIYPNMPMYTNFHSSEDSRYSNAEDLTMDTWQHMTWVRSGSGDSRTVEFYIDGKSQFTESSDEWTGPISIPNPDALWLGHDQDWPNGGYQPTDQFYGAMDEAAFWDRALTPLEVSDLYNQGGNPIIPAPGALVLAGIGAAFVTRLHKRRAFWMLRRIEKGGTTR